MVFELIDPDFSICKLQELKTLPAGGFWFLSQTDEELSLVCETRRIPDGYTHREDGYKAFRVQGELDFSLIRYPCRNIGHSGAKRRGSVCGLHLQPRITSL